ncbi:hypothetical protein RHI9324_03920 [Rhizobium sp. CECT 9324]|jgi:hypothetical protein|nr:hypothetical protein RHI9324_03920 [Rhizobium sp. CECT 9324]
MPHSVETLSFDLFGLARRLVPSTDTALRASETKRPVVAKHDDDTDAADCRRHEIFFWGMFPIL